MLSSLQTTFLSWPSSWINPVLCCLIIGVCYFGDQLLRNTYAVQNVYFRVAVDNSTHAAIGGLCWAIVESEMLLGMVIKSWMSCFASIFLASVVDIDHVIAAGTFSLEKATHLKSRPIFHNTSLVFVIVLVTWFLPYNKNRVRKFSLMFLSCWLSHHLRDANRRGLWLFPFGHTPPLSFPVYVGSIILLALFVRFVCIHYSLLSRTKLEMIV